MKIFNKIVLALFLLSATACSEDFLDLTDPNAITTGNFWTSPDDVADAIVTLYPTFNSVWNGAPEASVLRSDAVALAAVDFAQFNQYYTFVNTPVNGLSDGFWFESYTLIFRVNTILKEMEAIEFPDPAVKDVFTAEARFFRGAAYFRLAHLFGEVPVVLEPAESEEQFDNAKSSLTEVWDQAIADLEAAKAGLPEDTDQVGQVNKFVATGFLGKCFLYRAGYLNDDSFYSKAAAEFKEIIDSGRYGLVENWLDNFTATNENNEESIYEGQYDVFTGSYAATQDRPGNASVPGISGEIVSKPSEWIFEEMSKEMTVDGQMDTRLLNTLYFDGGLSLFGVEFADLGDGLVCGSGDGGGSANLDCWEEDITGEAGFWDSYIAENYPDANIISISLEGCFDIAADEDLFEDIILTLDLGCTVVFDGLTSALKADACDMSGGSSDGGNFNGWFRKYLPVSYACHLDGPAVNNERILRYADILLMYAEALVMSGGSLTDAGDAVNQIRARVNLETKTFAGATDLMEEIEHQRVVEFVMEGTRYYDLIRWGVLVERLQAHGFPDGASNINVEKHKYFPIPLGEINSNSMLDQNPLWQ